MCLIVICAYILSRVLIDTFKKKMLYKFNIVRPTNYNTSEINTICMLNFTSVNIFKSMITMYLIINIIRKKACFDEFVSIYLSNDFQEYCTLLSCQFVFFYHMDFFPNGRAFQIFFFYNRCIDSF